jgi:hypothetical protein
MDFAAPHPFTEPLQIHLTRRQRRDAPPPLPKQFPERQTHRRMLQGGTGNKSPRRAHPRKFPENMVIPLRRPRVENNLGWLTPQHPRQPLPRSLKPHPRRSPGRIGGRWVVPVTACRLQPRLQGLRAQRRRGIAVEVPAPVHYGITSSKPIRKSFSRLMTWRFAS